MSKKPYLLVFFAAVGVAIGLYWPLALGLNSHWSPSAYGTIHAWSSEHILQNLLAGENPHTISDLGYPWIREARFIGWAPMVASWLLIPLFGALGAYQVITLLSAPICTVVAARFIQQQSQCGPLIAAPAGLLFGFCPYQLATLQTGEIPKAQLWVIPLFLMALLQTRSKGLQHALLLAAISCITSFTSPYYGLALPLLAIGAAVVYAKANAIQKGITVLVATAIGLLPGLFYFGSHPEGLSAFYRPALAPESLSGRLPDPHPIASIRDLMLGLPTRPADAWGTIHESYLGLLLVVATAWFFWKSRQQKHPGRRLGLLLLSFGVLLSFGPRLALVNHATAIPMPASVLEWFNYPIGRGGMYYRMVPFAVLGLALILASSLANIRRGATIMWCIATLHIADGLRSTGPWPRPVESIAAESFLRSIAGNDGAVLLLPTIGNRDPYSAQKSSLRALLHKRPETALPTDMRMSEVHALQNLLQNALGESDPPAALRAQGFRYVIYAPRFASKEHRLEKQRLDRLLPEGQPIDGYWVWDLGPTSLNPRSLSLSSE